MANAFGVVNWKIAGDKKQAYDEWYNEPYIVNQFGTTIKTYGEALWAEIVERFIDNIIPLPEVPTKTKAQLAKEATFAKRAEKAAVNAVEEAAREAAKAKRQAKRNVFKAKRNVFKAKRNVFKPKLSSRQKMASQNAKDLLAKQGY
jgi:hypothetical protein